jgi:hypothetical protein
VRIPEKEAIMILKQIINGIAVLHNLFRNCIVIELFTEISRQKIFFLTMAHIK